MHFDDSYVAILIGCKHPIDHKETTVRQFNESRRAVLDDVVVGHNAAIFAYEEAATLGDRMAILSPEYPTNESVLFTSPPPRDSKR